MGNSFSNYKNWHILGANRLDENWEKWVTLKRGDLHIGRWFCRISEYFEEFHFNKFVCFQKHLVGYILVLSIWVSKVLLGPLQSNSQLQNCQSSPFTMLNIKNMRMSDFLRIFLENPMYNENWKRERKTG